MKTLNDVLQKIKKTSNRGVKWEDRSPDEIYISIDYTVGNLVRDLEEIITKREQLNKLWDQKRAIERSVKKKGCMSKGQWLEINNIKGKIHDLTFVLNDNNAPLVD